MGVDESLRARGAFARSNRRGCQSWHFLATMWYAEPKGECNIRSSSLLFAALFQQKKVKIMWQRCSNSAAFKHIENVEGQPKIQILFQLSWVHYSNIWCLHSRFTHVRSPWLFSYTSMCNFTSRFRKYYFSRTDFFIFISIFVCQTIPKLDQIIKTLIFQHHWSIFYGSNSFSNSFSWFTAALNLLLKGKHNFCLPFI